MRLGGDVDPEALPAIAKVLREYRKLAGKVLKEVARDSGVSISHLSKLENGKRVAVSKRAIGNIASALNIPAGELFTAAAVLPRDVEREIADPSLANAVMIGYRLPTGTRAALRRMHLGALAGKAQVMGTTRGRAEPEQLLARRGYTWRADAQENPPWIHLGSAEVICAGDAEHPDHEAVIRFELAHAFAHLELDAHPRCDIRAMGEPAERDATSYAAFLLAPNTILVAAAQGSRLEVWEDGPGDFIREIAGRLGAPAWLVARRLGEEGLLAQAAGVGET